MSTAEQIAIQKTPSVNPRRNGSGPTSQPTAEFHGDSKPAITSIRPASRRPSSSAVNAPAPANAIEPTRQTTESA